MNAKPIDELKNVSGKHYCTMISCVNSIQSVFNLQADIVNRFPYPSLWAAIDKLLELKEEHTRTEIEMYAAGYTYDDAITLHYYEDEY